MSHVDCAIGWIGRASEGSEFRAFRLVCVCFILYGGVSANSDGRLRSRSAMMTSFVAAAVVVLTVAYSVGFAQPVPEVVENSIGMKLVYIPPGEFAMGAIDSASDKDERPRHNVQITKAFLMGQTEVTNAQWRRVMTQSELRVAVDSRVVRASYDNRSSLCQQFPGSLPTTDRTPPSIWSDDDRPVDRVAWDLAVRFCEKLSGLPAERRARRAYRLPTEAEWEYACRAGAQEDISADPNNTLFPDYCWFFGNSNRTTHAVAQKKPNPWGLYDMHGNVWEWCSDWYSDVYYAHDPPPVVDPKGPKNGGPFHVARGGSWYDQSIVCRSSNRFAAPSVRFGSIGFRVVVDTE